MATKEAGTTWQAEAMCVPCPLCYQLGNNTLPRLRSMQSVGRMVKCPSSLKKATIQKSSKAKKLTEHLR